MQHSAGELRADDAKAVREAEQTGYPLYQLVRRVPRLTNESRCGVRAERCTKRCFAGKATLKRWAW